ncbi:uncharacterized protein LOC109837754 isoform X2 [Asparagus officinalis]|uniref:uncharacterized protein LOC109837754 isoform X2 n=1 Tax=Asparagus officinalis TaxID=4686 RepID=UPI00098E585C|nr:uncharacterized protein LOC109837754 isoform X2 [Asparagus officinalis]
MPQARSQGVHESGVSDHDRIRCYGIRWVLVVKVLRITSIAALITIHCSRSIPRGHEHIRSNYMCQLPHFRYVQRCTNYRIIRFIHKGKQVKRIRKVETVKRSCTQRVQKVSQEFAEIWKRN